SVGRFVWKVDGGPNAEAEEPTVLEGDDAESDLDVPLVVTPTRNVVPVTSAPYSVATLSDNDILERLGRSLPELLNETPSVMVQKTAHGQGSPFIRGFTGYRNLALIDGVRLNNSAFRDGPNQYWNTIDPYSVRSIELVKGQGSVLYGSDAIGGTLNVLTSRPLYADSGSLVGGRTYGRISSAEQSYTGRFEGSVSEADQYGFLFGFTGKDYGDLRTAGQGVNRNSGYDEWDFDAKAEFFLSPDTRLTFLHQQVHQDDAWRTHSTIYGIPYRGTTIGTDQRRSLDQDRHLTYLQLEGNPGGVIDHYLVSISHHRQSEEQYRVRAIGDGRINISGFDVDTYGALAQFSSDTHLGYLTYGASYYIDYVDSFRDNYRANGTYNNSSIQGPVPDDSTYELADVFLQDQLTINDHLDVWLGARATLARAVIGRGEDPVTGDPFSLADEWTSSVASARFVQKLDDEGRVALFGGVSEGFRAPNLSDLSRLDLARSGEIETPSPGLDPEEFTSFEIGIRRGNEKTRASAAWFYTDIEGLIVGTRTGRIIDGANEVTKINGGDGHVSGVELEIEQDLTGQLTLFGWMSWQDGDLETGGIREPMSRLMPFTAEAGIRWENTDGDVWVELLAYGADKQDKLPARDLLDTERIPPGGTPGYLIGTLRGGWELNKGLTLTAALENVTDEIYRVHGSGINGPERNFILGAEWT
ncbi:MAG: TonB-dependent receptor, partial [Verrucomicrobiales bacterium]